MSVSILLYRWFDLGNLQSKFIATCPALFGNIVAAIRTPFCNVSDILRFRLQKFDNIPGNFKETKLIVCFHHRPSLLKSFGAYLIFYQFFIKILSFEFTFQVNIFHNGCIIVELRDYRRSTQKHCDITYLLLKPTPQVCARFGSFFLA